MARKTNRFKKRLYFLTRAEVHFENLPPQDGYMREKMPFWTKKVLQKKSEKCVEKVKDMFAPETKRSAVVQCRNSNVHSKI